MLPFTLPNAPPQYLPRYHDLLIPQLLAGLAAIAIDGPKGVGKTATASNHANLVLELDEPSVVQALELGMKAVLQQ